MEDLSFCENRQAEKFCFFVDEVSVNDKFSTPHHSFFFNFNFEAFLQLFHCVGVLISGGKKKEWK
jgi:hypothetical protein